LSQFIDITILITLIIYIQQITTQKLLIQ